MIRLTLLASTVSLLQSSSLRVYPGDHDARQPALDAIASGRIIDPLADRETMDFCLDRDGIEALMTLAHGALGHWENGDLAEWHQVDETCPALVAAIGTLEDALDELRAGELDGLSAEREDPFCHDFDQTFYSGHTYNDAGEYLGC